MEVKHARVLHRRSANLVFAKGLHAPLDCASLRADESTAGAMLYLTRKPGETIVINDDIEVTVIEVRGRAVKLGFTFPAEATVLRKKIHDKIREENIAAAQAGDALAEVDFDPADLPAAARPEKD